MAYHKAYGVFPRRAFGFWRESVGVEKRRVVETPFPVARSGWGKRGALKADEGGCSRCSRSDLADGRIAKDHVGI